VNEQHKTDSSKVLLGEKTMDLSFDTDPDFISFCVQNKTGNEAISKFEEAAKLRRADIIKTAMGEE